jgi:hypothetical protein
MPSEGIEGDEWDAYVMLHVRQGRTWDRLPGASPMATEAP